MTYSSPPKEHLAGIDVRTSHSELTEPVIMPGARNTTAFPIEVNFIPEPEAEAYLFDHFTFQTDHMLYIPWTLEEGWGAPEIKPYGPLELEPPSSVIQYGQSCFEGMKAYRDATGRIALFRPDMNMKRMNSSVQRIALPPLMNTPQTFDGAALIELIKELIRIDKRWVPSEKGRSLYIRPMMLGNERGFGLPPPTEALLLVVLSAVGPFYAHGLKYVSLYGTTEYIRAAPGGTGAYKIGGNYAPTILPSMQVAKEGYSQNLWLHGPDHHLTEVGTMNVFVVFQREGMLDYELATPPLNGLILAGVTRDTLLTLARNHASGSNIIEDLPPKLIVSERLITMMEVKEAAEAGTLVEVFGAGTAVTVCPVEKIGYLNEDVHIPTGPDGMGPISRYLWAELVKRQTAVVPSDWNIFID
ncbi:hypothetical protein NLJ89_g8343 [Agrocybe chaxingu]|uniref:Branched-chain-amino-acid aminotransferase n=1 Tax=Agrocybe chaxingu TaxID=84603 RepID=A0A9W8JVJ3_9AGAR|nr:hypothetical protein NLJ89_g8343 [Agrocybe chaxingu]